MKIKKNISLAQYTTFKIGGLAKYFLIVNNLKDLIEGVKFAKQNLLPLFVLGGGSNLLVSDNGFQGLVIKMEIKGIMFEEVKDGFLVSVGAGEDWDSFVSKTIAKGFVGLENLSFIPGTVGASVMQNIGAFGREVKDFVFMVDVFDLKTLTVRKYNRNECKFKYRDSFFKSKEGKDLIVIKVTFLFKHKVKLDHSYSGLNEYLGEKKVTAQGVREAVIQIRNKRYPAVDELGSSGCFFKNPIISTSKFVKIKKIFPELPSYEMEDGRVKIPVAWLIEKLGWKGYRQNAVGVYKKHSLILVNYGGGTFKEIKKLADEISKDIFKKTNLKIEKEVVFLE